MKKAKNGQKELNMEALPVQAEEELEFTVEDILREFGSGSSGQMQEAVEQPVEAEKPDQTEKVTEQTIRVAMPEHRTAAEPDDIVLIKLQKRTEPPINVLPIHPAEPEEPPQQKQKTPKKQAKKPAVAPAEQSMQTWANKLYSARVRLPVCVMVTALIMILTFAGNLLFPDVLDNSTLNAVTAMLWVVSLLVGYDVLSKGLQQLISFRFGVNAMVTASSVLIAIDALQGLGSNRMNLCAIGALEMSFALWGLRESWRAKLANTRVAHSGDITGVCRSENAWDGDNGLFMAPADADRFDQQCAMHDPVRKLMGLYVPFLIMASFAVAMLLNMSIGAPFVRSWLMLQLASTPLAFFICYDRPRAMLAKALEKIGAAVGGWKGARAFRGRHTVLLRDEDLFSIDNVVFNGVKLCGGYSVDQVISYASAATEAAGSPLAPLFDKLCQEQNCRRYHAGAYRYYEGGGLGAEVLDDIVLMGTLPFMNSMGVHKDAGMKVKQAVYLSINGELACVFAVKYKAAAEVSAGLTAMVEDGHFDLVLATKDFLVTPELLSGRFGIEEKQFIYPRVKDRLELPKMVLEGDEQGAILRKQSFVGFALSACGGRALYTSTLIGLTVALLSGVIGFVMMAALIYMGALQTVSALDLTIFLLAWLVPELLTIRWMKSLCKKVNFPDQKKEKSI